MKTINKISVIISIIAILISLSAMAQDRFSIAVYQDPSLAFFEDDHFNTPYTMDLLFRLELQGKQFKSYYFEIVAEYEHAELFASDYKRFGFGVQWVFNKWTKNFEYGAGLTTNIIYRFQVSHLYVFALNLDLGYKLSEHWKVSLLGVTLNREDLKSLYGTNDHIKFNGYIGLKYQF